MVFEMLRWWYGTGWLQMIGRISEWTRHVERTFSFIILLRTLFAPWRRIITVGGKGLDAKMRALFDNLVSRCVGFVVRSTVLFIALFGMLGAFLGACVISIIWPLLPVAFVYGVVRSITG